MGSVKDADLNLGFLTKRDTKVKLPRPIRVKNKTPAPIQITAEQILREARERQEPEIRPPKQKITDPAELNDYRVRKRKEFEDHIRRVRHIPAVWVKYAQWEVYERAIANVPPAEEKRYWQRYIFLWINYALNEELDAGDMERTRVVYMHT